MLESYYINFSLMKLKEALKNYNNDMKGHTLEAIQAIGLNERLENVKKVYMFGFVRNDKRDGALDTLTFLNELKPKSDKQNGGNGEGAVVAVSGGGRGAVPNTHFMDYDIMADAKMDRTVTTWFTEVFAVIAYKIMRVLYYEKMVEEESKSDGFVQSREYYNHLMKEYLITLFVSVCLYMLGWTRVFFALMFDLIISTLVMMILKNEKATMFPVFLIVFMFNFK